MTIEDNQASRTPLVILYTSTGHVEESTRLRHALEQTGIDFEEQSVDSEYLSELAFKFGGQVHVPGVQVEDMWFVENEENMSDSIHRYWLDQLLARRSSCTDTVTESATVGSYSTTNGRGGEGMSFRTEETHHQDRIKAPEGNIVPCSNQRVIASDIEFDPNGAFVTGKSMEWIESRSETETAVRGSGEESGVYEVISADNSCEDRTAGSGPQLRTTEPPIISSNPTSVHERSEQTTVVARTPRAMKFPSSSSSSSSPPPPQYPQESHPTGTQNSSSSVDEMDLLNYLPDEKITPEAYLRRSIRLPNGKDVPVVKLIRVLLGATTHEWIANGNALYYFFRGQDGIKVWHNLFLEGVAGSHSQEGKELEFDETVKFGRMLIEHGIVHNYTPKVECLQHCFLVLQPLQEPRLLNTFLMLPVDHVEAADPMEVIMQLSHEMDVLTDGMELTNPRDIVAQFQKLEENVCQLQVVNFPDDPRDKVTFGLNLFNLIIRHVMLLCNEALLKHGGGSKHWRLSWPKGLEEMDAFMRTVCYSVGGKCCSLAALRDSLCGRLERNAKIVQGNRGQQLWKQLTCRKMEINVSENIHYSSAVIQDGDPRIIFAMSLGTQSSPVVSTIYPNRLNEGLQAHAELYCQQNVRVKNGRVILPSLISWHRQDFGRDPENALFKILGFLSPEQLSGLRSISGDGRLKVVFSGDHNWDSGLPHSRHLRFDKLKRQEHDLFCDDIEVDLFAADTATTIASSDMINFSNHSEAEPASIGHSVPSQKTTSSKSARSFKSIFDRDIVQVFARMVRGTSQGDMQPLSGTSHGGDIKLQPSATVDVQDDYGNEFCFNENFSYVMDDDYDEDNMSFFQSTVSGMTYGSDFEDLLMCAKSKRQQSESSMKASNREGTNEQK